MPVTVREHIQKGFAMARRSQVPAPVFGTKWVLDMVYAGIKVFPAPTEAQVDEFMNRLRAGWPEIDELHISEATRHINSNFAWQRRQDALKRVG